MKICISSTGDNLDADIDPRFGRCHFFLIIDLESMNVDSISNESIMTSSGAGIQAAQKVANKEVDIVITGNIGPNAFQTLKAAGIKVITGINGTGKEVLDKYKNGELKEHDAPNVASHYGINN